MKRIWAIAGITCIILGGVTALYTGIHLYFRLIEAWAHSLWKDLYPSTPSNLSYLLIGPIIGVVLVIIGVILIIWGLEKEE